MLKHTGSNTEGWQFWTLYVPPDRIVPGLEIGVVIRPEGIEIGGEILPWSEIDADRAGFSESFHPKPFLSRQLDMSPSPNETGAE